MISDFKIIFDNSFNCYETVIASMTNWWFDGYEMLFLNAWGFSYDPSGSLLFGKRMDARKGNILLPLETYYGARTVDHVMKSSSALNFIEKETLGNRPVILNTDIFWCPWNSKYKRIKDSHSVVVIGVDRSLQYLYCIDRSTEENHKGVYQLPFDDYFNGYNSLTTFKFTKVNNELDWKKVLGEAIKCLNSRVHYGIFYRIKSNPFLIHKYINFKSNNFYSDMIQFSVDLEKTDDLEREKVSGLVFYEYPIMKKVADIANGRRKFGITLKYLEKKFQIQSIADLAERLIAAGWIWEEIKFKISQCFNTENPKTLLLESAEKIRLAAGLEKDVSKELLEVSEI